jgi:hypothetical protein
MATNRLSYGAKISLNMQAINNGNVSSVIHCGLAVNTETLNTKPHVVFDGLKCTHRRNK